MDPTHHGADNGLTYASFATGLASAAPRHVAAALVWAVVVALAGGLVTGWALVQCGMLGGILLWGAGALGGYVARRIMGAPHRVVAWTLVAACVAAFLIGETAWIRANIEQAQDTWLGAATLLPTFFSEYTADTLIGLLFALFGAQSAYWQAGRRYRLVAVVDDDSPPPPPQT